MQSPNYISIGSMSRCFDQNNCFQYRIQIWMHHSTANRPVKTIVTITTPKTPTLPQNSGQMVSFWSQSQPQRRPYTNVFWHFTPLSTM
jgi:hypothetical protein